jgi:hypothetical protein
MIQYILGAIGAFVFLSTSVLASDSAPRSLDTEKLVSAIYQPAHQRFAESANLWALEAEVLLHSLSAAVGGIAYSVNTELPRLLGVVAFNSSEGD